MYLLRLVKWKLIFWCLMNWFRDFVWFCHKEFFVRLYTFSVSEYFDFRQDPEFKIVGRMPRNLAVVKSDFLGILAQISIGHFWSTFRCSAKNTKTYFRTAKFCIIRQTVLYSGSGLDFYFGFLTKYCCISVVTFFAIFC